MKKYRDVEISFEGEAIYYTSTGLRDMIDHFSVVKNLKNTTQKMKEFIKKDIEKKTRQLSYYENNLIEDEY